MINNIIKSLEHKKNILILTHNNPDPDAIGSAYAMQFLIKHVFNKPSIISYIGVVGRVENRELIKQCNIKMVSSFDIDFSSYDHIIVVDTQPQSGNLYIPDISKVNTIIDHHITRKPLKLNKNLIADIRTNYGSSSTIVSEYLFNLGIKPDINTATALCFGISTDAIGKARDSTAMDRKMLGYVYPYVSLRKLSKIQNTELPRYHYKTMRNALENAKVAGDLLFCDLNIVKNTDLIAEVADYMIRLKDINSVFITGLYDNKAHFSLRHKSKHKSVGIAAMKIVKGIGYGGGHARSAGGQVPIKGRTYNEIIELLTKRLLKIMSIKEDQIKDL